MVRSTMFLSTGSVWAAVSAMLASSSCRGTQHGVRTHHLRSLRRNETSEFAERLQEFELALVDFLGERALLRPLLPYLLRNFAKLRLFLLPPGHQCLGIAFRHRSTVFQLLIHPGAQRPFIDCRRNDGPLLVRK